jgi:hypothetical protein
MRFTNTAKYFVGFLLGLAAIVLLILFLSNYQPKLTSIIASSLLVIFAGFLLYVAGGHLFSFLGERADNILAVYTDVSGKALHIFSSFSVGGGRSTATPLRSIQYYCVITDTQKVFYTVLLSHPIKPTSGRSGYEGFSSVEETVLQGDAYKAALANYNLKGGQALQPADPVAAGKNQDYAITTGANTYKIINSKGFIKDTLQLCCFDEADNLLWKKKL